MNSETVSIESRDYWFKIVDFLQQNWALLDAEGAGCVVWFFGDSSGVFDDLSFPSFNTYFDRLDWLLGLYFEFKLNAQPESV